MAEQDLKQDAEGLEGKDQQDAVTTEQKPASEDAKISDSQDDEADIARAMKLKRDANAEAAGYRKELESIRAELKQVREAEIKAKRDAELAEMEEVDKYKAIIADKEAEAESQKAANRKLQVENSAIAIATQLGFHNPADAARSIDMSTIEVNGVIDPSAIEQQVRALAERSAYLVKKAPAALKAPPGAITNNAPLTQSPGLDLLQGDAKVHAEDYEKFRKAQNKIGRAGALETVRAWERLAEKNEKVRNGEWMDDALKERGERERSGG